MSVDFIESFEQGVKILFTSILQILYAGYPYSERQEITLTSCRKVVKELQ